MRTNQCSSRSRWVLASAACAATGLFLVGAPRTARAAGVVGTGTPESCTDAALDAALAGGGLVTFDCGGPATIDISPPGTGTKTIAADTTIDGGGMVTISGGNAVGVFNVNSVVNFNVQNLTLANGGRVECEVFAGGVQGGAINNDSGTLTVTNSTFTANSACLGGAIATWNGGVVTNSTFRGNRADTAGGIGNFGGTLTVTNSTFTGNSAAEGGAIGGGAMLTVTNSTFTGNSADDLGGAISHLFPDACIHPNDSRSLTVTNSTFTGNSAGGGAGGGGGGGGITNGSGPLTVTNCTFTGNNSAARGGGILNFCGTVIVTNTTFTHNGAEYRGGTIANLGSLTIRNSILANSPPGGNCFGPTTDGGHNLDDGTSCGFNAPNTSLSNTDAQLDPAGLQDNGGPTQTIALQAGSPAIDAGDPEVCGNPPVNNRDQRGFVRPGVGHTQCSIGAYEADAVPAGPCTGDCDGNGMVTINELMLGVNIALGTAPDSACPAFETADGMVDTAQLIKGVNNALNGCGGGAPCTASPCGKCGSGSCISLCGFQDTACISNTRGGCNTDQDCPPGNVCLSLPMGVSAPDYCSGVCVTLCP